MRVLKHKQSSDNLRTAYEDFSNYNTSLYLRPITAKVFEFKTKRLYFRRRVSHQNHQVIIINFEGVVGDIVQKNLYDETYQLTLRHGAIEGLQSLSRNYQIVFFSFLNEKLCQIILSQLEKESIIFDGFYQKLKSFKSQDTFNNYNQVFVDFELLQEDEFPTQSVQANVLMVLPLCMDSEELKDKEGEELLFQDSGYSLNFKEEISIKGVPVGTEEYSPMIFLVPHLMAQPNNWSLSMINICNILQSVLITSCVLENQQAEILKEVKKEQEVNFKILKEEEDKNRLVSNSS